MAPSPSRTFDATTCKVNIAMKAANSEPEIVTRNGKPVSVILPIKKYQEMIERLEDAKDVAWLKRARRKKLHFRPLEDVLADLPQR
jgi:prevent-host-death family protein